VSFLAICHLLPHGFSSDKLFMKKRSSKEKSRLSEIVRQRLRRIRAERCLTQENLCDRAGISIDAVSRIEGGSRVPTLDTLEKLATALGIGVVDLVKTTDPPKQKMSPAIQRIVNLLDTESPVVQAAIEKAVKAMLQAMKNGYETSRIAADRSPIDYHRE
jgi:transcriptional regulator with XRE-family HTH domain